MKLLVTGGNGFIGKSFLTKINSTKRIKILSLVRSKSSKQFENYEEYICDLNDEKTYFDKINDFKPEVLVHLAWDGIPDFSAQKSVENLISSLTFLESVFTIKSCKKLLISGSCWEYNKTNGICCEDDFCTSKDYFTWAKLSLLDYLLKRTEDLDISFGWFRIFYAFGPGQRSASIIPALIRSIKENKVPDIRNPKNGNDFIYVDDIANAFLNFININVASGIYNLGGGQSITIEELLRITELSLTGGSSLSDQLKSNSKDAVKTVDFYASINKSKTILNWKPKIGIEEAINLTVKAL